MWDTAELYFSYLFIPQELFVDKMVIKSCFPGLFTRGSVIDRHRPGPVDGPQAHRAGLTGGVDDTSFQLMMLKPPAGITDRLNLSMCRGIIRGQYLVISLTNDLSLFHNNRAERTAMISEPIGKFAMRTAGLFEIMKELQAGWKGR